MSALQFRNFIGSRSIRMKVVVGKRGFLLHETKGICLAGGAASGGTRKAWSQKRIFSLRKIGRRRDLVGAFCDLRLLKGDCVPG
jgi:hypothetical protein